jgi:aminoglycoside phosphotransferase
MTEPKPVAWRIRKIGDGYAYRAAQHGNNAEPLYPASSIAALQAQIAERDKTIEKLREDAERYRWIRDRGIQGYPGEMDAAIDAARKEQP